MSNNNKTKYTTAGALTGLAGALLIRKLVSSKSNPMSWSDALIWGGSGATIGGLIGRGLATVDTEKPSTEQSEDLNKQLQEVENQISQVKKEKDKEVTGIRAFGWPGIFTLGGIGLGTTVGHLRSSLNKFQEPFEKALINAWISGDPKRIRKAERALSHSANLARKLQVFPPAIRVPKFFGRKAGGIINGLLDLSRVPKFIGRKAGGTIGGLLGLSAGLAGSWGNINKWMDDPNSKWFAQSDESKLAELDTERNEILKALSKGN